MAIENPKEEINKEGWEENAAVIIGSKEELPQLLERLERLENEGKTKDLSTYIRMHKEVLVSKKDPEIGDSVMRGALLREKGLIWDYIVVYHTGRVEKENAYYLGGRINFIDSEGNLATIKVDSQKISDYKDWMWLTSVQFDDTALRFRQFLEEGLKKLGFNVVSNPHDLANLGFERNDFEKRIKAKKERLEREAQEKKKEEFDF